MTRRAPGAGRPLISANAERHAALHGDPDLDAHAFHCHDLAAVRRAVAWRKPGRFAIVSDDGHRLSSGRFGTPPETVEAFLRLCHEHGTPYEHLNIPLSTHGQSGERITGRETFTAAARATLEVLSGAADELSTGGVLGVVDSRPTWNGQPVQLVGASWYGALVAERVDLAAFLDALHGYGLNLTRVWLVEQWTALGAFGPEPGRTVGRTPFVGRFEDRSYDLRQLDERFFEHLDHFVRLAAERGIVVQVCLFDRAGVQYTGRPTAERPERWGHAFGSPYLRRNNRQAHFEHVQSEYPERFMETTGPVATIHGLLVDRVGATLRDHRNVLVEIMNEPLDVWGDQTVAWHRWVARRLLDAWGHEPLR